MVGNRPSQSLEYKGILSNTGESLSSQKVLPRFMGQEIPFSRVLQCHLCPSAHLFPSPLEDRTVSIYILKK